MRILVLHLEPARTVEDVEIFFDDFVHHGDEVLGIVFEIGVLDDDVLARHFFEAGADGGAFSGILGHEHADVPVLRQRRHEFACAVFRSVVDDHDFLADAERKLDRLDLFEEFGEVFALVVRGNEDA